MNYCILNVTGSIFGKSIAEIQENIDTFSESQGEFIEGTPEIKLVRKTRKCSSPLMEEGHTTTYREHAVAIRMKVPVERLGDRFGIDYSKYFDEWVNAMRLKKVHIPTTDVVKEPSWSKNTHHKYQGSLGMIVMGGIHVPVAKA